MNKRFLIEKSEIVFDSIHTKWNDLKTQKVISSLMIFSFLTVLVVIHLHRLNLLPESVKDYVSDNHLYAITFAFNILLIKEIFDMIFFFPRSISYAQRKQLQILSLILIRFAFEKLSHMGDPVTVSADVESLRQIAEIITAGFSGLLVYAIVYYFYKLENKPVLIDPEQRDCFIAEKKAVSLALIVAFFIIGIQNFTDIFFHHNLESALEIFFTVFIFADILTILIAMRYSQLFLSLFRNSGFALAIVLIRISITAPPYYREVLALVAAIFSYSVAWIYNKSILNIALHLKEQKKAERKERKKRGDENNFQA